MRRVLLRATLLAAVISCAPTVDTPADHQRAVDAEDSGRLAAQLGALPGVVSAQATLHRAISDPLTRAQTPASAAILIVIDDHGDRASLTTAARELTTGAAPDIAAPQIVIEASDPRPELARVGPFSVERSSRRPLILTLAVALAAIAALALALASYARRGNSAQ